MITSAVTDWLRAQAARPRGGHSYARLAEILASMERALCQGLATSPPDADALKGILT